MSESIEYDTFPNLDGVVSADDVSQKGGGRFAADYVNWARVCYYLRKYAPGWQPTTQPNADGGMLHAAPDGTFYLMIGFQKLFHRVCYNPGAEKGEPFDDYGCPPSRTQYVPHAIMDHTMKAKKNPDARDISDAFVRGVAKAAALLFGLGWQLWSKDDPLERDEVPVKKAAPKKPKPEPEVLEAFPLKEHALSALSECKTKENMRVWGMRVKVSSLIGQDLEDLREAGKQHLAKIIEGGSA